MNRRVIPNAWYGDHLPSGEWCAIVPTIGVYTHLGNTPTALPPGEPWGVGFVRCTAVGGFRFAGQAHSTLNPACWEWNANDEGPPLQRWKAYAPPCVGVSPVIYDLDGILHRSDGSIGSQGYRYVNMGNGLVSGDETYGPFHGLFEYTYLYDNLWIGQGATDGSGVQVLELSYDKDLREVWTLRQLELGDCRFVRANRVDNAVALAFTRPEGVVLIQTTMSELRALPPVQSQPAPSPVPVPPSPEPSMLSTVQRIRAKYPTPLGARHWEFLVEVCQATGAQLFRKDGGDHCWVPPLSRFVSLDVIGRGALGDVWVDILGDAENAAVPAWDVHQGAGGEFLDVSGIVLPGQPGPVPGPVPGPGPTPTPQPPSGDLASILRRLDALEGPRKVSLRTHDGSHVLCAEGGGGGEVNATRTVVGAWETWTLESR